MNLHELRASNLHLLVSEIQHRYFEYPKCKVLTHQPPPPIQENWKSLTLEKAIKMIMKHQDLNKTYIWHPHQVIFTPIDLCRS
jgi:hypothetical protein